ncbi:protein of unknown function [Cupriavidus taiwanensis]|nr:protein of unknown function [Cupriavidus taiwanensis]
MSVSACCRRSPPAAMRIRWRCGSFSSTTSGPSANCRSALRIWAHCRCLRASWWTFWSRMASGAGTEGAHEHLILLLMSREHLTELVHERLAAGRRLNRGHAQYLLRCLYGDRRSIR